MTDIDRVITTVAGELSLPKKVVKEIVISQWNLIRETIPTIELDNCTTEEEFNKLKIGFNLASLGKFYTTYKVITAVKNRQERNVKNKETKASK